MKLIDQMIPNKRLTSQAADYNKIYHGVRPGER